MVNVAWQRRLLVRNLVSKGVTVTERIDGGKPIRDDRLLKQHGVDILTLIRLLAWLIHAQHGLHL